MAARGRPGLVASLLGRLAAGVAGGLAGGVVFGVLMQLTGTIPMVARLVDQESLVVGWAVHMSIAVFVGVTYALIFGLFSVALSLSIALGVFYGLVWWVLGGLTLMPLRLGLGLFVFDTAAWQSLAGHIAYGFALGVGYALTGQGLLREPSRDGRHRPERVAAPPASPAAPAGAPAAYPPPAYPPPAERPPSPGGPPRGGVSPLPPHARELRRRWGQAPDRSRNDPHRPGP